MSRDYLEFSRKLMSEILDPFQMFLENHKQTNKYIIQQLKQLIADQSKQVNELNKKEEEYLKFSRLSEKFTLKLEKEMQKEGNQEAIQQIYNQSLSPKMTAEESMLEYKTCVEATNQKWCHFEQEYDNKFKEYDICDEHRIIFARTTLINLIKGLQVFHAQQAICFKQYDEKIIEMEDKKKDIKRNCLLIINKGKLEPIVG